MKNFFKNLLSRKNNQKINKNLENSEILFEDLKLQKLNVSTVVSGNTNILRISDEKTTFELLLDPEKSLLLSIILQDYSMNKNLKKSLLVLNEKE